MGEDARKRATLIGEFFERHVRQPIGLLELVRLLDATDWIDASEVTAVTHLKGELPVEWNLGETVLAIRLFPAELETPPVLYIRISEPIAPEVFVGIVKAARARVLQAARG
jgi:hypothetical protein